MEPHTVRAMLAAGLYRGTVLRPACWQRAFYGESMQYGGWRWTHQQGYVVVVDRLNGCSIQYGSA